MSRHDKVGMDFIGLQAKAFQFTGEGFGFFFCGTEHQDASSLLFAEQVDQQGYFLFFVDCISDLQDAVGGRGLYGRSSVTTDTNPSWVRSTVMTGDVSLVA
mgnify:CR=1 FL=1